MISDKTILFSVLFISIAVGLQPLGDFFDSAFDHMVEYQTIKTDLEFIEKQGMQRIELFDNRDNDEYFYEKIKQTDVYRTFIDKYPDSTLTSNYTDNAFVEYALYHIYSDKPHSVIMVTFEISLDDGLINTDYFCIDTYSTDVYVEMPTLLWLESNVCDGANNSDTISDIDDTSIFRETLLEAFEDIEDLVINSFILHDNIVLAGVQLQNDILLVEVDATKITTPIEYDDILDIILDTLDMNVPIVLEIVR